MYGRHGVGILAVSLIVGLAMASVSAAEGAMDIEIEGFGYPDQAALEVVWVPENAESPAPRVVTGADGVPIGEFTLPFATLKGWRAAWDHVGAVDLSAADRILVRMRTDDPGAMVCMLYARSGDGWYNFPQVGVSSEWTTATFMLRSAGREQRPGGWEGVDRIRLGFSPGARRDAVVEVAWIRAAKGWRPEHIGSLGRFSTFDESRDYVLAAARPENREAVAERVARAEALRAETLAELGVLEGRELDRRVGACRQAMAEAYALVQTSRPDELRGFWCHYGSGPVMDGKRASWDKAIPMIADGGLNAIFPNMLFSGVAYYPSKIVPTHPIVAEEGDQLAACINAARARGVQVHLWKVCWQIGWQAPPGAGDPFREKNRLQVSRSGDVLNWLCPSDPGNRKYEVDSILEAADYDIDGIHLDYIRYNGANVCYCDGCRQRFEEQTGKPVENWPEDAAPNGPRGDEYAAFKVEQITGLVREVRQALKEKKPELRLSAAVWEPAPSALRVSQDWLTWVDEGLLDFVCPMIYTEDMAYFRATLGEIVKRVDGHTVVCPGMKASMRPRLESQNPLDTIIDQINAVRELGAGGFVMFELWEYQKAQLMPYLKDGVTSGN